MRFCQYSFAFTICPRVLSVRLYIHIYIFTLKTILFNNYFFILITFILLCFILFYFILFLSIFFLPFILSHVDERLLVFQPGVSAVPLRWESQLQDTGPQETSQLHEIGRAHV